MVLAALAAAACASTDAGELAAARDSWRGAERSIMTRWSLK